jgi:inhibitor of KinA sporulation pathway (predicted exonuclease)
MRNFPQGCVIFDLEATCQDRKTFKGNFENEIIEIGAVFYKNHLDANKNRVTTKIDEFQTFVYPKLNPQLSDFCTDITSITQEDLKAAPGFFEAVTSFRSAILAAFPEKSDNVWMCSWGFYDQKQLQHDLELHEFPVAWNLNHISLKHQYMAHNLLKKGCGMSNILKRENIPLTGTHHRGIDDARNIGKIYEKCLNMWDFGGW